MGPAPKDPITSVTEAFLADTNPAKINLGVVCIGFLFYSDQNFISF